METSRPDLVKQATLRHGQRSACLARSVLQTRRASPMIGLGPAAADCFQHSRAGMASNNIRPLKFLASLYLNGTYKIWTLGTLYIAQRHAYSRVPTNQATGTHAGWRVTLLSSYKGQLVGLLSRAHRYLILQGRTLNWRALRMLCCGAVPWRWIVLWPISAAWTSASPHTPCKYQPIC